MSVKASDGLPIPRILPDQQPIAQTIFSNKSTVPIGVVFDGVALARPTRRCFCGDPNGDRVRAGGNRAHSQAGASILRKHALRRHHAGYPCRGPLLGQVTGSPKMLWAASTIPNQVTFSIWPTPAYFYDSSHRRDTAHGRRLGDDGRHSSVGHGNLRHMTAGSRRITQLPGIDVRITPDEFQGEAVKYLGQNSAGNAPALRAAAAASKPSSFYVSIRLPRRPASGQCMTSPDASGLRDPRSAGAD